MKILIAGGTGAIGRRLVPLLAPVHAVTVLSRSGREVAGAASVAADALDADAARRAVHAARPDAVINLLTAIPDPVNPRHMARDFAVTNRLRTEGTRNLLAAADVPHVAESIAFAYEAGPGPAQESEPLWSRPAREFAPVLGAVRDLEEQVLGAGGTVLRLGHLHGPGTAFGPGGGFRVGVLAGKVRVVGAGRAVFSFAHVDDVAAAFALAVVGPAGVYNVVDDEPAAVSEWLPDLARQLGVPAPGKVPAALARLVVGGWGVAFMTQLRGADNGRAKAQLGWSPSRSWRDTLAH